MRLRYLVKLVTLLVLVTSAALFIEAESSLATSLKPTETSFKVSPSVVGSGGGTVLLSARVTNATKCILIVSPTIPGFAYNHVCSSGVISYKANLPKNTTTARKTYSFRLEVIGRAGQKTIISPTISAIVNAGSSSSGGGGGGSSTGPASTVATISVPAEPDALLQVGNDIWVASCSGNAVTEINSRNYTVVQTLSDPSYQFNCPDALTYANGNIWVANNNSLFNSGDSITEFNESNGSLYDVITGSAIAAPNALTFDGNNVWVLNAGINNQSNPSLTQINASNDMIIRQIKPNGPDSWQFSDPTCLAYTGTDVWVSNKGDNQILEFNLNGAIVRSQSLNPSTISMECVGYHGGYVWASSYDQGQLVEYNANDGAYVRLISGLSNPDQLTFSSGDLFVIDNYPKDSIREYSLTGEFIKTITSSSLNFNQGISNILSVGSQLWATNYSANTVSVFNP